MANIFINGSAALAAIKGVYMKNYIVLVAGKTEFKESTLKRARALVMSIMNVNAVKGIEETVEIYKEVTKRKKIDSVTSKPGNVGTVDKVFTA